MGPGWARLGSEAAHELEGAQTQAPQVDHDPQDPAARADGRPGARLSEEVEKQGVRVGMELAKILRGVIKGYQGFNANGPCSSSPGLPGSGRSIWRG